MSHLENFIREIRLLMYGGMITLPLTIGGTMTILGLFTANYAMLFFLLGFLIITPILSYICNSVLIYFIVSWVEASSVYVHSLFSTNNTGESSGRKVIHHFNKLQSDVCGLKVQYKQSLNEIETEEKTIISSTWVAMISFFIGYILKNAIELYSRASPDLEIDPELNTKVNNRKFQSIVSIMSIILFAIIVIGNRLYTKCESKVAIIITSLIFIPLGFSWYKALASVGQDRLSDLFGIANRLLSPTAVEPVACIPSK